MTPSPKFIVLLGPPGAGKGTQAQALGKILGLAHVSSGDLFREQVRSQTELGRLAKSYMDKGQLVPDAVTVAMVRDRLQRQDCLGGAILDGFPRTAAQAEALDRMLLDQWGCQVDKVPYVSIPEATLVERLSGRWTCRQEGHVYHLKFHPPRVAGKCDIDGSALYQREDDREETVRQRIRVYSEQTAPLADYYRQRGVLVEIDGDAPIAQVTKALVQALGAR
jgi:adenylate kinase